MLSGYGSVKLGLLFTFGCVSLHAFLSLFILFVLFVSLANAAVNVHLRYFFCLCIIDFLHR